MTFEFAAVLLAAGRSRRMGRPKMLLPWGQTTVLGHLIAQWKELSPSQIAVVCAADDAAIAGELGRLGCSDCRIVNSDPDRGMFSSIQCAARWIGWRKTITHWVVALGDQPHLQKASLKAIVHFGSQNPGRICQPSHRGRPRHPVIVPRRIFEQLAVSTAANLKEFLQSVSGPSEPHLLDLNDPGLDLDLDHPADYEKALSIRVVS